MHGIKNKKLNMKYIKNMKLKYIISITQRSGREKYKFINIRLCTIHDYIVSLKIRL